MFSSVDEKASCQYRVSFTCFVNNIGLLFVVIFAYINGRFKHAVLGTHHSYLQCCPEPEVTSLLLEVSDRECVVALHLILTIETLLC